MHAPSVRLLRPFAGGAACIRGNLTLLTAPLVSVTCWLRCVGAAVADAPQARALQVTRELSRRKAPMPVVLLASAHRAPHLTLDPALHTHQLADDELVAMSVDRWGYPARGDATAELLMERASALLRFALVLAAQL